MLVARTQSHKRTNPDTLQFKWKHDHNRAIPLAAKYTLCFFFPIESAQHVMLFSWIGSQKGRVFLFGSVYGSAGSDTVRIKR